MQVRSDYTKTYYKADVAIVESPKIINLKLEDFLALNFCKNYFPQHPGL